MTTQKLPPMIEPELLNGDSASHESWHAFEIMAEFVGATENLKAITPAVSIFGSARTKPHHQYYHADRRYCEANLSDAGL